MNANIIVGILALMGGLLLMWVAIGEHIDNGPI